MTGKKGRNESFCLGALCCLPPVRRAPPSTESSPLCAGNDRNGITVAEGGGTPDISYVKSLGKSLYLFIEIVIFKSFIFMGVPCAGNRPFYGILKEELSLYAAGPYRRISSRNREGIETHGG